MAKNFKIVVYVPISDADKIRQVFAEAGAGQVGNYDSTSFSVKGTGRFRPLAGAKPAVGVVGKLEEVEEERIETVVRKEDLKEGGEERRPERGGFPDPQSSSLRGAGDRRV